MTIKHCTCSAAFQRIVAVSILITGIFCFVFGVYSYLMLSKQAIGVFFASFGIILFIIASDSCYSAFKSPRVEIPEGNGRHSQSYYEYQYRRETRLKEEALKAEPSELTTVTLPSANSAKAAADNKPVAVELLAYLKEIYECKLEGDKLCIYASSPRLKALIAKAETELGKTKQSAYCG